MLVSGEIDEIRRARWEDPALQWALVPTMGYLHEGHLSLVRRARGENERLAVSIYVNPTQFAPSEDLNVYPQDLDRDLRLLQEEEVDLVFVPDDELMYGPGFQTEVRVKELTQVLEGISRPTHFQGVTTVVAKLFNIIQPHRAYFGQKDAQQAVVIRRMVRDLNFNLDVVVCPIVREEDGLALSSRNWRLTKEQREAATVLHRALRAARSALRAGERNGDALRQIMGQVIRSEPLARVDYVSVAHPHTLRELDVVDDSTLLSLAVHLGEVRLIDNLLIKVQDAPPG